MYHPGITRQMHDLDRLKGIQAVNDGDLQCSRAAERLGLTTGQVWRLVLRYRQEGPVALVSLHPHRPSNHRLKAAAGTTVAQIQRERLADFGPTLAHGKLRTSYGIDIAKETVRRLQMEARMWIPGRWHSLKIQQPLARRARPGELV